MSILLLALALPPGFAGAAPVAEPPPTGYCFSLEKLQAATNTCQDNLVFAEAARRCVDKLRAERATLSQGLAAAMAARGAQNSGATRESFEATGADLDSAVGTLGHLLAGATKARNDMLLFEGYLKWPFAVEPGVIESGKLEQAFAAKGCFTENLGLLRKKVKEMDSEIQSLEQDQRDALAMRDRVRGHAELAGSDSLQRAARARAPASVAPKVAPKAKGKDSTITGDTRKTQRQK